MKHKGIILWAIIGGILVITGCILCVAGIALGGGRAVSIGPKGLTIGDQERYYYESDAIENISQVNINVSNMKVRFEPSEDEYFRVKCDASKGPGVGISLGSSESEEIEISCENGVLNVVQENKINIFVFHIFSLFSGEDVLTIYVPKENNFQEIKVQSSNSAISLTQNIQAERVDLHTNNGIVRIDNIFCSKLCKVKTSNGKIECSGTFHGEVDLDTSNGAIQIGGTYKKGLEAKSSNGRISAKIEGKRSDYSIDLDTSNGSITIDGVRVKDAYSENASKNEEIRLKTSNGSIEVKFSDN